MKQQQLFSMVMSKDYDDLLTRLSQMHECSKARVVRVLLKKEAARLNLIQPSIITQESEVLNRQAV